MRCISRWMGWLVAALLLLSPHVIAEPQRLDFELLDTQPHNPRSFTQGFIKRDGYFYESSGLYGRSFIQRYQPQSTSTAHLPKRYFAEGLTLIGQDLYLLTWKAGVLLLLDKDSLKIKSQLRYQGEGWGLTDDGQSLIMSNGSSRLTIRDPKDFAIKASLDTQLPLQLNELEYVDGIIWANNWQEDSLYAISRQSGCVLATLDLSALRAKMDHARADVLNGIAYDKAANALWVTGKYWTQRYLIRPTPLALEDKAC